MNREGLPLEEMNILECNPPKTKKQKKGQEIISQLEKSYNEYNTHLIIFNVATMMKVP